MAPTFCSRCGDAVNEGCDPRDELSELDALLECLNLNRDYLKRKINRFHHSPIAPTFCNRCIDAVEKGCDPSDDLYAIDPDALSERLRLKGYDLKRKINQLHSSIIRQLAPDVMSTIFEFCLPDFTDHKYLPYIEKGLPTLYLLEPFAVIGERLLGQRLAFGLRWWFMLQATIIHL